MSQFVTSCLCATLLFSSIAFADDGEGPLPPGKAANAVQGGEYGAGYTIGAVGGAGFVVMGVALTVSGNGDGPVATTSTTTSTTTATTTTTSTTTATATTTTTTGTSGSGH